jgi:hypothetical protein
MISDMTEYYVEIIEDATGHVEKRIWPMAERCAEQTQSGAMGNLNHAEWTVRIVAEDK